MSKNMPKNRTFPCKINGKYYPQEVDFDKLLEEQKAKIIEDLENKLNSLDSKVYKDEGFEKYIAKVKRWNVKAILNPENKLYRSYFDRAVLKFGSYEFVQDFLQAEEKDVKDKFFDDLNLTVLDVQSTLIDLYQMPQSVKISKNMQILYINFLKNFAPQELQYYTRYPVNEKMLKGMKMLKDISAKFQKETAVYSIPIEADNFNNLYHLDNICEVVDLYKKYNEENDFIKKQEIIARIDQLTSMGISVSGNNMGLINLTNFACTQTLNQMIDSLARRIHIYKEPNISEDFDITLKKLASLKKIYSIADLRLNNMALNKLIQLSRLDLLQDKERKKLNEFLDNEFERKDIQQVDMSKFDEKIAKNRPFSEKEVGDFYEAVMNITLKDGKMPIKYNEYLITKLIEENPEFSNRLNDNNKLIILENFASNMAEQALGKKYYVTFSTRFLKEEAQGEHAPGFIKLKPISFEYQQSMDTVLKLATIFHEIRHGEQEKSIRDGKIDHLSYMIVKERIINHNEFGFYDKNYFTMYEELDAEYFSLNKMSKFLETLGVSPEFRKTKKWESIIQIIENKRQKIKDSFDKAKSKKFSDGKMVDIEEKFDEMIAKKPSLATEEPLLKIEYNDDGSKKDILQIFMEFLEKMKSNENKLENYDLYKYILISNMGRNPKNIEQLENVQIPEEIDGSVRLAIEKLKTMILSRRIEEKEIENNEV